MDDIKKALLAQDDQLKRTNKSITEGQKILGQIKENQEEEQGRLDELENEIAALSDLLGGFTTSGEDFSDDSSHAFELSKDELLHFKQNHRLNIEPVPIIQLGDDWQKYSESIDDYIATYELDTSIDPLMQLLSPEQFKQLENKFHDQFGNISWNKWDYTIVGLAVVVGFLVDLLVVKLPAGAAEKYVPKDKASPVGKWINNLFDTYLNPENNSAIRNLENWATTPYDAVNIKDFDRIIEETDRLKMNANLHRLKTPGHDPVLGLIFGVLDCMNGTISVFDQKGSMSILDNPNFQGMNLFTSITKVLAHFITDIGTTRGLVPPFFSVTQAITMDTPFKIDDRGVERQMGLNELAERMYTFGGYNFNHFLTMSLTPLTIEMIVRSYRWMTKPTTSIEMKSDYKLQSMLTLAHSAAMSSNVIKIWLSGWNPLAFNYAQMLMLVKSFFSLVKAESAYYKIIDKTLMNNWEQIYRGSW